MSEGWVSGGGGICETPKKRPWKLYSNKNSTAKKCYTENLLHIQNMILDSHTVSFIKLLSVDSYESF